MTAPLPLNEASRLDKLRSYHILDTPAEAAYDDLAQLAAYICETPIALVNLIDADRQWFKAAYGLDMTETARELAFCNYTILDNEVLIIPDATEDNRFASNALVMSSPHLRFYAGAPLTTSDGFSLGSLCVLDTKPRTLSEERISALKALSRQVVSQFELHKNVHQLSSEIKDHQQTQAVLHDREKMLHKLSEHIPGVFYQYRLYPNGHSHFPYASASIRQLYGVTPEQARENADSVFNTIHPDDRDRVSQRIWESYETLEIWRDEYRVVLPQQGPCWRGGHARPERQPDGSVLWHGYTWDITERKQTEEQLSNQRRQLISLLNNIPHMAWLKDRDNRLIAINNAYSKMCGVAPELIVGKTDVDLWGEEQGSKYRQVEAEVLASQESCQVEEKVIDAQEQFHWVETYLTPVLSDSYQSLGLAGIAVDITDRKETELELQRAKEAAEFANRAKSDFLASMSHELRTPLNVILGFAQIMYRDSDIAPQYEEYIQTILNSSNHLLELINSVLDLSKIEAGHLALTEDHVDLIEQINMVHTMLAQQAIAKGLEFDIHLANDLPQFIYTDQQKLRQVLINILGNSIKFTAEGSVTLNVSAVNPADRSPQSDTQNATRQSVVLRFEIKDTGIGIAPDDQERIFDAFEQAKQPQHSAQGTGLGLTLSARFVELMGGQVSLSSQVGQGTTFTISLPVYVSDVYESDVYKSESQRPALSQPTPDPFQYRVLLVDDQPDNRHLIIRILRKSGFDLKEATNGAEAVELWKSWHPHLVFMDMRMPVMDGYEAVREIRNLERSQLSDDPSAKSLEEHPIESTGAAAKFYTTKIIALTATAFYEDRARIFEAGCDDVVHKPFRVDHLHHVIAQHLDFAPSPQPTARNRDVQIASSAGTSILKSGDLDFMPSQWRSDLHSMACRLSEKECLDLINQIPSQQDQVAIALKMLLKNFRFDVLSDLTDPV